MVRVDEYPAGPFRVPVARTKIRSWQIPTPPGTSEVAVGCLLHATERAWAVTCMNSTEYEPESKSRLLMKPGAAGWNLRSEHPRLAVPAEHSAGNPLALAKFAGKANRGCSDLRF